MPLWNIFHPEGTFTDTATKQALSESITAIYTRPGVELPAFYVVVNFISISAGNTFIGGRTGDHVEKPFIRLAIDNIAIRMPDNDQTYKSATEKIDQALKPHIEDKGYDWEYHVTETERRLWKINGLAPPPWKSEGEKVWREQNRAVPL